MEIDKNIFEKYGKSININNLNEFENINFIDTLVQKMQQDLEDMYYKFLTENGYKLDKPYKVEQIKAIKEDLEKQDKFVDYLEYTEFAENCSQAYHYILPFFNCISNPLSEEDKQELLEKWKENKGKDK